MAEEAAGGGGTRRGAVAGQREQDEEGVAAERGPGAAYHMFVLMEELLDKLKLLSYEEEALRRHNMRPLSRCPSPELDVLLLTRVFEGVKKGMEGEVTVV
uniref:Intraflagellar transport protein 57 homolog n=1 Tax=Strix occidentalis caurina TaxID=311401 RepID=A0A8D0KVI0_STROC